VGRQRGSKDFCWRANILSRRRAPDCPVLQSAVAFRELGFRGRSVRDYLANVSEQWLKLAPVSNPPPGDVREPRPPTGSRDVPWAGNLPANT